MTLTRVFAYAVTAVLVAAAGEAVARTNPLTRAPVPRTAQAGVTGDRSPAVAETTLRLEKVDTGLNDVRMVAVDGDRMLVGDKSTGLHVFASTSAGLRRTAAVRLPGEPLAVTVRKDLAAVACAWGGLAVVDLSKEGTATVVGSSPTTALTRASAFFGDRRIAIADWNAGLRLMDFSKPGHPVEIATLPTPGHVCDVAVVGDTAYVADFEGGLHIVDIKDPARPAITGTFPAPAAASVAVSGKTLFVCDEREGLLVLETVTSRSLRRIGAFPTQGAAHAVRLAGTTAVVSDLAGDVYVLDVSDPALPELVSVARGNARLYSIAAVSGRVHIADGQLKTGVVERKKR